ncbi:MAG: DUF4240 domain-containing protein [Phycisphaerales bacterium]|nr:DUF4240 domain-containing protein [Planctomycetota bacterium]MCH8508023.1 DUF4240 domain-containing protein [Phycisphaerales bacterium]
MSPQAMDESRFWSIFEPLAAIPGEEIEEQEEALAEQLSQLSDDELIAFQMTYKRLHANAYRWDLWEVAYHTGGGCSDDSFAYFRNWLIGRGRQAYHAVMENPDNLADYPMGEDPMLTAQSVEWDVLAGQIWEQRDDSRDDNAWFVAVSEDTEGDFNSEPAGQPFHEEDLDGFRSRYPRLAEMYNIN